MSSPQRHHDYFIRVGYADTDRMGFAHHSRILVYMESARTEMLRTTGDSYLQWENRGILLPVIETRIEYGKPALYDDVLRVRTRITELTRLKLRFDYELDCEARGVLIGKSFTQHVFMNREGRPIRVGAETLDLLKPFVN